MRHIDINVREVRPSVIFMAKALEQYLRANNDLEKIEGADPKELLALAKERTKALAKSLESETSPKYLSSDYASLVLENASALASVALVAITHVMNTRELSFIGKVSNVEILNEVTQALRNKESKVAVDISTVHGMRALYTYLYSISEWCPAECAAMYGLLWRAHKATAVSVCTFDEIETNVQTKLERKISAQAKTITQMQESLRQKNLDLDALHHVWCNGGCGGGVHRWSENTVTEELVARAEANVARLKTWFRNAQYRKKTP